MFVLFCWIVMRISPLRSDDHRRNQAPGGLLSPPYVYRSIYIFVCIYLINRHWSSNSAIIIRSLCVVEGPVSTNKASFPGGDIDRSIDRLYCVSDWEHWRWFAAERMGRSQSPFHPPTRIKFATIVCPFQRRSSWDFFCLFGFMLSALSPPDLSTLPGIIIVASRSRQQQSMPSVYHWLHRGGKKEPVRVRNYFNAWVSRACVCVHADSMQIPFWTLYSQGKTWAFHYFAVHQTQMLQAVRIGEGRWRTGLGSKPESMSRSIIWLSPD